MNSCTRFFTDLVENDACVYADQIKWNSQQEYFPTYNMPAARRGAGTSLNKRLLWGNRARAQGTIYLYSLNFFAISSAFDATPPPVLDINTDNKEKKNPWSKQVQVWNWSESEIKNKPSNSTEAVFPVLSDHQP